MNNYEYIIASLPRLGKDAGTLDADEVISAIRSQCSGADNALIDLLLDSFDAGKLTPEFYKEALKSRNKFIRNYLLFDLQVRDAKTEYLNAALGRPEGEDLIEIPEGSGEFEQEARVREILSGSDILARERGLDDVMWEKADSLTELDLFDIDIILAFIAKIKIADRWNKLDPETGRELFRRLVSEIRNTK